MKTHQSYVIEALHSDIAGTGLFCSRRIWLSKGQLLLEYMGKRYAQDRMPARMEHSVYNWMTADGKVIDGSNEENLARFFNHSCDPNCEAFELGNRVFIHTIKPVAPGTELTISYNMDPSVGGKAPTQKELHKLIPKFECRCGSRKCRGHMLDPSMFKE